MVILNGISISPTPYVGQQAFNLIFQSLSFSFRSTFHREHFQPAHSRVDEAINHLHSSLNLEGRPGSIGSQDEIRC